MTLGEKLQQLRKDESISQEKFAEMMNVSRQAVSKWELDQSIPEMETLIGISNYFNVSMDYLLKEQIDGVKNNHEKTSNEEPIQQEKTSKGFDFYKITMLIILAMIMTAFRFFITGDSETGLLLAGLAGAISIGVFLAKMYLQRSTEKN
jgi:transcriptional regulator with XRE-family HTH domain